MKNIKTLAYQVKPAIPESNSLTIVNDKIYYYDENNKEYSLKSEQQEIPEGTDRQVLGYQNGELTPITLGWAQFSDLNTPPPFEAGVLSGMTFNPDGSAMYYFQELNSGVNALAKQNTIPVYGTNGVLKVSDGVADKDAVNVSQLNALISRIEALENI